MSGVARFDSSLLRIVSYGQAATNLDPTGKDVEVFPIEFLPAINGEVTSDPQLIEAEGLDSDGVEYKVVIQTDNSLTATWLNLFEPNRTTPPNIMRGEQVLIWQYGDADKFYWTATGEDQDLRRKETVIYRIAAHEEKANELNSDNSYYLEVSSHSNTITLKTSQKLGEYCRYTFQFDLKEGFVTLADDIDNFFTLDSQNTKISMKNADSTEVHLDKTKIYMQAPDEIKAETTHFEVNCETFVLNAEESIDVTTKAFTANTETTVWNASTSFVINTPKFSFGSSGVPGFSMVMDGGQPIIVFNQPVTFDEPVICTDTLTVQEMLFALGGITPSPY